MPEINWRVWRGLREQKGQRELRAVDPPTVPKKVAKQVKGDKDGRGRRRGSENN